MAFVNELVSEEDKQKIDWTKFIAWTFSEPHRPWKWTVDHEHDVFLIPLEQPGYNDTNTRPNVFALYWKKEIIRVEASVIGSGEERFWDTLIWKVSNIDIPDHLKIDRNDSLNTLKEAICAHGRLFDIEHVKTVHVEFV